MDEIQEQKSSSSSSCRGATLIWRKLNVYTKDKKCGKKQNNLKRLINNSTGFVQPGTLMAVMGSRWLLGLSPLNVEIMFFIFKLIAIIIIAYSMKLIICDWFFRLFFCSGAGKSTLMSALAFRNMGQSKEYLFFLNKFPFIWNVIKTHKFINFQLAQWYRVKFWLIIARSGNSCIA